MPLRTPHLPGMSKNSPFCRGSMDICWNYTMSQFMQLAYAVPRILLWIIDYYGIFGNRPLHMQFLESSKDIRAIYTRKNETRLK